MKLETISLSQDGSALVVTISNGKANVISQKVIEEIHGVLDEAVFAQEVGEIVITGEGGKFFSGGADINEIAAFVLNEKMTREERRRAAYEFSKMGQNLVVRLRKYPKPVTAMINGMCFGGGLELALGCHKRVVAPDAVMGFPEVTLGIIPGWGGTAFFPKIIAQSPNPEVAKYAAILATNYICAGRLFKAGMGAGLILAEKVLEQDMFDTKNLEPSQKPVSYEASIQVAELISGHADRSEEEALETEAQFFAELATHENAQEGIRAFLEKREPNFKK
jgi:enoyl-CoA hydratase